MYSLVLFFPISFFHSEVLGSQTDLLNAQQGHQQELNKAALLSSQNESLEAQLARASTREQELRRKEEAWIKQEEALQAELQTLREAPRSMDAVHTSLEEERRQSAEKDKTIQNMALQLKEAEQALTLAAASPKAAPQPDFAADPSPVAKGAVEELLRRLRSKDREVVALQVASLLLTVLGCAVSGTNTGCVCAAAAG